MQVQNCHKELDTNHINLFKVMDNVYQTYMKA